MSQRQLGIEAGFDPSVAGSRVNRYEAGSRQADLSVARNLAAALAVPVSFLYEEDDRLAALIFKYHRVNNVRRSDVRQVLADVRGPEPLGPPPIGEA